MTITGAGLSERRQQQLLRSYGTHSLDGLFVDPDRGTAEARASMCGSRHHRMYDGTVSGWRPDRRGSGSVVNGVRLLNC